MNVLVAGLLLVVGISLYFIFKPRSKSTVATVENNFSKAPVESSVNSEEQAEVVVRPITKRVYKKREVNGIKTVGDKGVKEEESK